MQVLLSKLEFENMHELGFGEVLEVERVFYSKSPCESGTDVLFTMTRQLCREQSGSRQTHPEHFLHLIFVSEKKNTTIFARNTLNFSDHRVDDGGVVHIVPLSKHAAQLRTSHHILGMKQF